MKNQLMKVVMFGWVALMGTVFAQGEQGVVGEKVVLPKVVLPKVESLWHLAMKSPVIWVLLVLSFFAVILVVRLWFELGRGAVASTATLERMDDLICNRDWKRLQGVCEGNRETVSRVMLDVLDFLGDGENVDMVALREIAELRGSQVVSQWNGRVTYLADVGAVAPLIGLLGTVFGMTQSLSELSRQGEGQTEWLSSGIGHALYATAGGLFVAVPAFVAFAYFRGRANRATSHLESAVQFLMLKMQTYLVRGGVGK